MKYHNTKDTILEKLGAIPTTKEIADQPELWGNIFSKVLSENKKLPSFLRISTMMLKKLFRPAPTQVHI